MPAKRPVAVSSDDEASSPAQKRPRTSEPVDSQDDLEAASRTNPEDEMRFEQDNEDIFREKILQRQKTVATGGIAEMGIIESVEMVNFMCHKYLTFKFGPQVNFIIGHNGSGKSAVLSAITVALGGKATTTGRGSGLKSFVREGQQVSEVTIVLKNQGEEAFKPKDYGRSIVITRRFTKDGSSSYKIKSKEGRFISNKREELSAICDHMNIQVDNPMNVLTQDSARQFLSASHAADKYRFFLKGTQLSQLSDEYETCKENIIQTDKILARKREAIPDLRTAYMQAKVKFEEASKAIEQREKLDELKKELAWTHVVAKEKDMKHKFEEVAKAGAKLVKLKADLAKAEEEFTQCTETVAKLEEQHASLGDVENLHEERRKIQTKINENKKIIQGFQADMKQIKEDTATNDKNIADLGKRIEEEALRMETHSRERRDEAKARLDQAQQDYDTNVAELRAVESESREQEESAKKIEVEGRKIDLELERAKQEVQYCKDQIKACDNKAQNSLAPYGSRIGEVIAEVKKMRWQGGTPVGPLGLHVKLKEQQWAEVMRIQLGSLMTAWAVTDARDRQPLKALLEKLGNHGPSIVVAEVDLFDFSRGEPDPQYVTPLRVLDVSDPYVLRILINQRRIESTFLAPRRSDGDEILLRVGGSCVAWCADRYLVRRFAEGGGQSNPMSQPFPSQLQLFTGEDVASQKRNWAEKLAVAEAALRDINRKRSELLSEFDTTKGKKSNLNTKAAAIYSQGLRLKAELERLHTEANEELPAGIAGLQEIKVGFEQEKTSLKEQYDDIERRKAEIDILQQPLITEYNRVKREIDSFEETKKGFETKIEDAVARRMKMQSDMGYWKTKIQQTEVNVKEAQDIADVTETEFKNWTEKAEEFCPRVEAKRSVDVVARNIQSLTNALKEREKKQGASVDEITREVTRTRQAYETTKSDILTMVTLNKALNQAVLRRLSRWHDFRRHIALRCKVFFQYNLSNRGYFGKVLFDHSQQTLQLRVQTEDTGGSEAREKDPKALSGGEKSFSTICLLLALWESIGCPIRCLDEFDVFMDAVNRRVSMKMMTDTAKASDAKQYILITPQDLNVKVESHVKIHKMQDPRTMVNQTILPFN